MQSSTCNSNLGIGYGSFKAPSRPLGVLGARRSSGAVTSWRAAAAAPKTACCTLETAKATNEAVLCTKFKAHEAAVTCAIVLKDDEGGLGAELRLVCVNEAAVACASAPACPAMGGVCAWGCPTMHQRGVWATHETPCPGRGRQQRRQQAISGADKEQMHLQAAALPQLQCVRGRGLGMQRMCAEASCRRPPPPPPMPVQARRRLPLPAWTRLWLSGMSRA